MNLNCKPGDLAIIVRLHRRSSGLGLLGHIIRVTKISPKHTAPGSHSWEFKGPSIVYSDGERNWVKDVIPDDMLLPLREEHDVIVANTEISNVLSYGDVWQTLGIDKKWKNYPE